MATNSKQTRPVLPTQYKKGQLGGDNLRCGDAKPVKPPLEPPQGLKFVRFRHLGQQEKSPHHCQDASILNKKILFILNIGAGLVTRPMRIHQLIEISRHVLMQDK
jgi:hypothetical protein